MFKVPILRRLLPRNATLDSNNSGSGPNSEAQLLKVPLLLVDIVAAIAVPFIVNFYAPKAYTAGEQFLLGAMIFIGAMVLELLLLADQAFYQSRRERPIWETRDALDAKLQEVRRLFHIIEEGRRSTVDLYSSYFDQRLIELEASLRDAAMKREITIDGTMMDVTKWLLESSFQGRPTDMFRAVFLSEDEDFFFDLHTKRYFCEVYSLVQSHMVQSVRRLIVYSNPVDLRSDRMHRLLAFHNQTAGYSCHVIHRSEFVKLVKDYKLHPLTKDFGIYGDTYLYKGLTNGITEIVGSYSRDPNDLVRFTNCFDKAWEVGGPKISRFDKVVPASRRLEWLFPDFDEDAPPDEAAPPGVKLRQLEALPQPITDKVGMADDVADNAT